MELTLDLPAPHEADVAASQGGARWSVAETGWKRLLPDLPDEVIALLATPVVVSAEALSGTRPADEDDERYPAPDEPCAARTRECAPHFLAPAPPRARRARHRS
jgi:hypothetical protein